MAVHSDRHGDIMAASGPALQTPGLVTRVLSQSYMYVCMQQCNLLVTRASRADARQARCAASEPGPSRAQQSHVRRARHGGAG